MATQFSFMEKKSKQEQALLDNQPLLLEIAVMSTQLFWKSPIVQASNLYVILAELDSFFWYHHVFQNATLATLQLAGFLYLISDHFVSFTNIKDPCCINTWLEAMFVKCRMLKEFVAQTKGTDMAEDSSEQQLMEVMMSR